MVNDGVVYWWMSEVAELYICWGVYAWSCDVVEL